jgi:hypothetical protein
MCLFQLVPHLSHLESPHAKMEGEHDEEHGIILKPGLLVGTREDRRPGKFMGRSMATFFWVRSVEVCWRILGRKIRMLWLGCGECVVGCDEQKEH